MPATLYQGQSVIFHIDANYVGRAQNVGIEILIDTDAVIDVNNKLLWDPAQAAYKAVRWKFAFAKSVSAATAPTAVRLTSPAQTVPWALPAGNYSVGIKFWLGTDEAPGGVFEVVNFITIATPGFSNVGVGV